MRRASRFSSNGLDGWVPRRPWTHQALALVVPLALTGREDFYVSLPNDDTRRRVVANRLTPGWFETVRIPVVSGRDFTGTTEKALRTWPS